MRDAIVEFERRHRKAVKEGNLRISDQYRTKKPLRAARIRPEEKITVMDRVDGDFSKYDKICQLLIRLYQYDAKKQNTYRSDFIKSRPGKQNICFIKSWRTKFQKNLLVLLKAIGSILNAIALFFGPRPK